MKNKFRPCSWKFAGAGEGVREISGRTPGLILIQLDFSGLYPCNLYLALWEIQRYLFLTSSLGTEMESAGDGTVIVF